MADATEQALRWLDDFVREYGSSSLNVTIDQFDTGCLPVDPTLWVLAIGQNVPEALVSVIGPECVDIAYDRLRRGWFPRALVPRRYRGCRGAARFRGTGTLDRAGPPTRGPGWYAFRLANAIQTLGFYAAIIFSTERLFVQSIGSLMEYGGCSDPPDNMATGLAPAGLVYGATTKRQVPSYQQQYSSYGPAIGIGGFIVSSVTEPTVIFSYDTGPFFNTYEPPGRVWMEITDNEGNFFESTANYQTLTEDGRRASNTGIFRTQTLTPRTYTGRVLVDGSGGQHGGQCIGGILQIMGNRSNTLVNTMLNGDPCGIAGTR